MNRLRQFLAASVFAALACSIATPAGAQQQATVSGVVTDPLGARVPGATVTLTAGAQSRETVSGSDGAYTFTGVAPGLYKVVATLSGFQTYTSDQTYAGAGATHVVSALTVGAFEFGTKADEQMAA